MKKVMTPLVHPEQIAGYIQSWIPDKKIVNGYENTIQMPAKDLDLASSLIYEGLTLSESEKSHSQFSPSFAGYSSKLYLYGASFCVVNELNNKSEVSLKSFPEKIITIYSQSKRGLKNTAKKLRLPLPIEQLVCHETA